MREWTVRQNRLLTELLITMKLFKTSTALTMASVRIIRVIWLALELILAVQKNQLVLDHYTSLFEKPSDLLQKPSALPLHSMVFGSNTMVFD